jgi:rhodanese-related sulfurtransferase
MEAYLMKYRVLAILSLGALSTVAFSETCPFKDGAGKSVCSPDAKVEAKIQAESTEATITTDALAALIRSGIPLTILDARSGKYDDGRRIPGAQSLSAADDEATIAKVAGNKKGLIVTYCSNLKCPASKQLATRLRKIGYTNVVEYPNGIAGWAEAGKAVQKAATEG